MKKIIIIKTDNKIEELDININKKNILTILENNSTNKGNGKIKLVDSVKNIKFYGWTSGQTVNKHILPNKKVKLYGDIFVLNINRTISNYTIAEYGELHYLLTSKDNENESYDNILLDYDTNEY